MTEVYGNVVSVTIDTDRYNYPIGSGQVTFSSRTRYFLAIDSAFLEIKTSKFSKCVQIDPFLEDSHCSLCMRAHGSYFCRDRSCFNYYCFQCWEVRHYRAGHCGMHTALMRRPRRSPNMRNIDGTLHSSVITYYPFTSNQQSAVRISHCQLLMEFISRMPFGNPVGTTFGSQARGFAEMNRSSEHGNRSFKIIRHQEVQEDKPHSTQRSILSNKMELVWWGVSLIFMCLPSSFENGTESPSFVPANAHDRSSTLAFHRRIYGSVNTVRNTQSCTSPGCNSMANFESRHLSPQVTFTSSSISPVHSDKDHSALPTPNESGYRI